MCNPLTPCLNNTQINPVMKKKLLFSKYTVHHSKDFDILMDLFGNISTPGHIRGSVLFRLIPGAMRMFEILLEWWNRYNGAFKLFTVC